MKEEAEKMMQRCLELAARGSGLVAPNPMVGAVLVHEGRVIGEGYHHRYGAPHAEVNCLNSVPADKTNLISHSTLYVSLEPCTHFGKTPPCTELILQKKIPEVVIGCLDPFAPVAGKGVKRLREAGVKVEVGLLAKACAWQNRRFFTFHVHKRPYIVLKWAQSADGFLAGPDLSRTKISNVLSDRWVHRWRSEEAAILIGAGTARLDDPLLTNRLWSGGSPQRIVLDPGLSIPDTLQMLRDGLPTWVYNCQRAADQDQAHWIKIPPDADFLPAVLADLHARNLLSVMVEGGPFTLGAFIARDLWDEARTITGPSEFGEGLQAPSLPMLTLEACWSVRDDHMTLFVNNHGAGDV
jgi:diaminohydroxyphosphoribosylaminopyrimidine deaminase/5-amino-6-(5-phosphoribosylamino)uracil reductase